MQVLFLTIVSKYRLHQCVALYHSIRGFAAEVELAVLAVDPETKRTLDIMQLPGMKVFYTEALEDELLKEIRSQRMLNEYCWTLKPVYLLYLMEILPDYEIYAYIDSDLYFFDNPMKLFTHSRAWSVLITTHKVNKKANGGFAAFRRSRSVKSLLNWWRDRCLERCRCSSDDGEFGDQGYMDSFRTKCRNVHYLEVPGVNAAPWNSYTYDYTVKNKKIYVGRSPLIFYHFSGFRLKRIGSSVLISGDEFPCEICAEYKKSLYSAIREIEEADPDICQHFYKGV